MRRMLGVVALTTVAAMLIVGLGSGSTAAGRKTAAHRSTTDVTRQVAKFQRVLAHSGYVSQGGSNVVFDLNERYCDRFLFSAMWPNPSSPYIISRLPEVPGQAPNTNQVPGLTAGGQPVAVTSRMRDDEALVLVGLTPPPMAYFSVDLMMMRGSLNTGPVVWPAIGDPINNLTIRTGAPTPFGRPFAVVVTANQQTQSEVDRMLARSGLGAAINNKPIPSSMFRMGLDQNGDQFLLAMRTAVPRPGFVQARDQYQASPPLQVFRVRPKGTSSDQTKPVYAPHPMGVPPMRVSGTGSTELDLNPTLQTLRDRIIAKYPGYSAQDVPINPAFDESYPGLQTNSETNPPVQGIAAGSYDARYLLSPSVPLPQGSFIVAYGVNHQATGKATYSSVSVYADPKAAVALDTEQSPELQGSANDFLAGQPDASKFYAWTFSRAGSGGPAGAHVTQLPATNAPFCQQFGSDRPVDMSTVQVAGRAYAEPATKTRPALSELLLDRMLVFTPKQP